MVLTVIDDHLDVLHGMTGNRSRLHYLTHPGFNCRDKLRGNRTADDFALELEAGAGRERFDSQINLAELPRAAGLFLVPVMAFRIGGNRLDIGNRR